MESHSKGDPSKIQSDARTLVPKHILRDCAGEILSCRFSGDGSLIAAALSDSTIQIVSSRSPYSSVSSLKVADDKMPATSLRFIPACTSDNKSTLYATYASGKLRTWHVSTKACMSDIAVCKEALTAMDCNKDGSKCAVAGSDFVIYLYDMATHQELATFGPGSLHRLHGSQPNPEGHTNRVHSVRMDPSNPDLLYTAGWDNTVQIWDVRQKLPVGHVYGPFLGGDALDVDPDSSELLTGSYRKSDTVQLWNLTTLTTKRTWPDSGDELWAYAAQFGKQLPLIAVAGGNKNDVRIYSRKTGSKVASFTDTQALYSLDQSSTSHQLCAGGASRSLLLFDLDPVAALL